MNTLNFLHSVVLLLLASLAITFIFLFFLLKNLWINFLKDLLAQIHDIMCKTNMEIDSSGWLAILKFLDKLVKCSIEGACVKGLSFRTAALNTASECLQILRLAF